MNFSATRKFFYNPTEFLHKLLTSKEYRQYIRLIIQLGNIPRYTKCSVNVQDCSLMMPDSASFLSAYHEIFVESIYMFDCESSTPYIVDMGANIGLSVLYFKRLFPAAEICALEADSTIYGFLVQNVRGNGYTDVTIMNKAVWYEDSVIKFMKEGADGGRIATCTESGAVDVEAIDVARLIEGRCVDFLKMDIEGAEVDVLHRCRNLLDNVQHIFIEFHSKERCQQHLSRLLEILETNGFRYHIHSTHQARKPFMGVTTLAGYDMLLNIFAWRQKL